MSNNNDPGDYVTGRGPLVIYVEPHLDQDVYVLYKERWSQRTLTTIRKQISRYENLDAAYAALEMERRKNYEKSRRRMNKQPMWDKKEPK